MTFEDDLAHDVHLDEQGQPRIVERVLVVDDTLAGLRLDHFLVKKIPRLSRTKLQTIIRTQLTHRDGRQLKAHSRVVPGDEIVIRRPARPEPPCPRTFGILFRDDQVLAVDKPAGLPVHASAKFYFNTLTRLVRDRFPDDGWQICHRLDRETSGLLLLARGRPAAAHLKGEFARHQVHKTYVAIVEGSPSWSGEHLIDLPLGLVDPSARINIRMEVRADALPARTVVTVLDRREDFALVECRPVTGRQHQIRVHLAAVGHPIVGDKLYGLGEDAFATYCDQGMTDELSQRLLLSRQALHAASIEFTHPGSGARMTLQSPLPGDMVAFLAEH